MSHRLTDIEAHGIHEDARIALAQQLRRAEREARELRLLHERHRRRMQACMPVNDAAAVQDFGTWVTL